MQIAIIKKTDTKLYLALFVLLSSHISCSESTSTNNATVAYVSEIEEWHNKRIEDLKSEDGWLNLVGLFWLEEGLNTFGSHSSNDFVFPVGKAPDFMGSFGLNEKAVTIQITDGVDVIHKDKAVKSLQLTNDNGDRIILSYGSLRWFIIQRGDRFGVRLRDLESLTLTEFHGIESYPIESNWRVKVKFEPFEKPKLIPIPNILGTVNQEASPGELIFEVDGKEYRLNPLGEMTDDRLWVIFSDGTTGKSTYGGGRYLWMNTPNDGKGILDFNKAYNPPCVFTNYATCPLPPEPNKLTVEIMAGEKYYDSGLH